MDSTGDGMCESFCAKAELALRLKPDHLIGQVRTENFVLDELPVVRLPARWGESMSRWKACRFANRRGMCAAAQAGGNSAGAVEFPVLACHTFPSTLPPGLVGTIIGSAICHETDYAGTR